jgi:hypothetical protein
MNMVAAAGRLPPVAFVEEAKAALRVEGTGAQLWKAEAMNAATLLQEEGGRGGARARERCTAPPFQPQPLLRSGRGVVSCRSSSA